jgi:hypothetical protein
MMSVVKNGQFMPAPGVSQDQLAAAEGTPAEVRRNAVVIGAYLGQERRRVVGA